MFAFIWTMSILMLVTASMGVKNAADGEAPALNSLAALVHFGLATWGLILVL